MDKNGEPDDYGLFEYSCLFILIGIPLTLLFGLLNIIERLANFMLLFPPFGTIVGRFFLFLIGKQ